MTATAEETLPPASLDPKSAGCWVPFGIAAVLVALAWWGVQGIVASTGPWAIESARNAVATSGLAPEDAAAVLAEVERLDGALASEAIDAQGATKGVGGLLESALIPLLTLEDVRVRRLSASGLDAAAKAEADAVLRETGALVDAELVGFKVLIEVLGPLTGAKADGARVELDDAALAELVERARTANAAIGAEQREGRELVEVDRAELLTRFRAHVDGVIGG